MAVMKFEKTSWNWRENSLPDAFHDLVGAPQIKAAPWRSSALNGSGLLVIGGSIREEVFAAQCGASGKGRRCGRPPTVNPSSRPGSRHYRRSPARPYRPIRSSPKSLVLPRIGTGDRFGPKLQGSSDRVLPARHGRRHRLRVAPSTVPGRRSCRWSSDVRFLR